ncbi:MAG: diaminopimelate epimerase [Marinilabiliales bacterium]
MSIFFEKFHGTGNDFIIINNLDSRYKLTENLIKQMCHRRFGIGSDGLLEILKSKNYDFKMLYYNSDGLEGTMCGNGGRCAVSFAYKHGIIATETVFEAVDGLHEAKVLDNGNIKLKMNNVLQVTNYDDGIFLDTGSPHFVVDKTGLKKFDEYAEGLKLRNDKRFAPNGLNVNFIDIISDETLHVTTYERGVENLTYSCGTGAIASAIVSGLMKADGNYRIKTIFKGGELFVNYKKAGTSFTDVYLEGPAEYIMNGSYK